MNRPGFWGAFVELACVVIVFTAGILLLLIAFGRPSPEPEPTPTVVTCVFPIPGTAVLHFIWETHGAKPADGFIVTEDGVYRLKPGELCLIGDEAPEVREIKPTSRGTDT